MRLAVYGTLRRGRPDVGRVKGFSLVFPGTHSYPTLIKNPKGKGAVVEMVDADREDLEYYDRYENVDGGLYIRTTAKIEFEKKKNEKAWIYVAGPLLWEKSKTFTEVPDADWLSKKTAILMDRVYEKEIYEAEEF